MTATTATTATSATAVALLPQWAGLVLSPGWGLLALGGAEAMHYLAYGLVRSFANAKVAKAGNDFHIVERFIVVCSC